MKDVFLFCVEFENLEMGKIVNTYIVIDDIPNNWQTVFEWARKMEALDYLILKSITYMYDASYLNNE